MKCIFHQEMRKIILIAVILMILLLKSDSFQRSKRFHCNQVFPRSGRSTPISYEKSFINQIQYKSRLYAVSSTTESSSILSSNAISNTAQNRDVPPNLLLQDYDGKLIDNYYNWRPLQVWERLIDIGSPVLGWWLNTRWDNITASFQTPEERQEITKLRARELKEAIVQGKSITFIKSGQALALRPDLLKSLEYVEELSKLQDEVGTFDNNEAMKIICEELGVSSTDEVFEFDPPYPIASASIGQVYRARLKENPNLLVAVKVQRPDALQTVDIDLYILRRIADIIKYTRKLRSSLLGIVDEFGRQLYNELNYQQEAKNCEKFQSYYGAIPDIYVPKIYHNYTRRRVLTMEFIDGKKGPWPENGEKMLTIGLQCSVLQLLGKGYFHADPHRGNLLQTNDGKLAYLDFGMMSEISSVKRFAIIGTVLGLVNKDLEMVMRNLNELEFFATGTNITESIEALNIAILNSTDRSAVSSATSPVSVTNTAGNRDLSTSSTGRSTSTLNFTRLNENILQIQQKLPVQIPPYYTQIIRSLTILEGLALYVDKDFKLVRGAYPFIIRQVLTDPSPELNDLFATVLVNKTTNRIRWNKLESWMKLSLQAEKAMKGNFQALKASQSTTNLVNMYQTIEDPSDDDNIPSFLKNINTQNAANREKVPSLPATSSSSTTKTITSAMTVEETNRENLQVLSQLLDYLLSDYGKYLREPLIDEIIDLINNIGGTSQNLLSLLTNRIIPPASTPPNRQQVLKFIQLIQYFATTAMNQLETTASSSTSSESQMPALRSISSMATSLQRLLLNQSLQSDIQPLLRKLNILVLQIIGKLIEQRSAQTVKEVLSGNRIKGILPTIATLLDFLPNF